ncbi:MULTISPECIES: Lrp/AsnC family transcriptional regulator [Gluconacetobacter]|nr:MULTISPECIES: Lrp/AsnC ligand binding domain-containing protein [Gluconacetobacter]
MDKTLDRIDRKLLRLLQQDGRTSNADLARQANLSPATCYRRTQRLFEDGFIRSVRAQVAPEAVDLATLAIVGVVLDRSTPDSFAAFETAARAMPAILDCYLVAGDFDFFVKIRVRDIHDFSRLHASELIALPCVLQTRTFFVMKEVVDNRPLAI